MREDECRHLVRRAGVVDKEDGNFKKDVFQNSSHAAGRMLIVKLKAIEKPDVLPLISAFFGNEHTRYLTGRAE